MLSCIIFYHLISLPPAHSILPILLEVPIVLFERFLVLLQVGQLSKVISSKHGLINFSFTRFNGF